MIPLLELAKAYWSAVFYLRRAPLPDPELATRILAHVAKNSTGALHDRALFTLRKINATSPSKDPGTGSAGPAA